MSNGLYSDVIVIGGGPAGSTIASLLAEKGWRVTLFEKAPHPRFHIGESLLPMNLPILERLGVMEEISQIGMPKYGAEFNSHKKRDRRFTFYFSRAMDKTYPMSYQVRRAEFDNILLNNSASKGVDVFEGYTVKQVTLDAGDAKSVIVENAPGKTENWQCRFVVDASGRDTFLANRMGTKQKNTKHNSAAIFAHFRNVIRREGKDEGNISIYWFKHGWFWMIPFQDGNMSIGAVCYPEYLKQRDGPLEEFLWQTIKMCPGVYKRTRNAECVSDVNVTGNYSYQSSRLYDDGYLLVGDAYAFLDPVFSSGVYLAMNSAMMGVDVVDAALRDDRNIDRIARTYEKQVRKGLGTLSWFIYRFNSPAMHRMFMSPTNSFNMEAAILSMLAGDVFRKTPIQFPLVIFKVLYYVVSVFNLRESWRILFRKKRNNNLVYD